MNASRNQNKLLKFYKKQIISHYYNLPKSARIGAESFLLENSRLEKPFDVQRLLLTGQGINFFVFRCELLNGKVVAVRIPKKKDLSTPIDCVLDPEALLAQEHRIGEILASERIPCSRSIFYCRETKFTSFCISSFVESDGSKPSHDAMGTLLAKVHGIAPRWEIPLAMQKHNDTAKLLVDRIRYRLSSLTSVLSYVPDENFFKKIYLNLVQHSSEYRLLHLDFRSDNILCLNGKIQALLDWGNALYYDPWFELFRISEFGYLSKKFELSDEFWKAYKRSGKVTTRPSYLIELIFRLDTAIMLTVLFKYVLPDFQAAQFRLKRLNTLFDEYLSASEVNL